MSEAQDFEQDPELKAMLGVFAALKGLDTDSQVRVIDYVERRLGLHRDIMASKRDHQEKQQEQVKVQPPSRLEELAPSDTDTDIHADDEAGVLEGISPVARKWMRRNALAETQLSILYSLGVDEIDLVATKVPGSSAREKLRNVMLLQGIASYLSSGAPRIDNEKLKEAAKHYDADVGGNFPAYLKSWASEIAGTRAEGNLTLTTRGLNSAKDLIKEMTQEANGGQ